MKLKVDSHTHTLASAHAYSTILENAQAAAKQDLENCFVLQIMLLLCQILRTGSIL